MTTRDKLVTQAALLLDQGGDAAVTLRAVAYAVGVSHNAPYRHFKDRNALLAAVAERDFAMMTTIFNAMRVSASEPLDRLKHALAAFAQYGRDYPARYRLLFSDPDIGAAGGGLEEAALGAFLAFAALVEDCQTSGVLPAAASTRELAGLLYATSHGLIDLQAGGRMREHKGLSTADQGISILLDLLGTTKTR